MSMKHQFLTTVAAILMVGVTTTGVNLSVIGAMGDANDARFAQIDARFEQVDARFERVDRRLDQMEARFEKRFESTDARIEALERRMDAGFREMGAAIARLEGLIQGIPRRSSSRHHPHRSRSQPLILTTACGGRSLVV